jgi:transcriptional regulator with XRE-family HTH domain
VTDAPTPVRNTHPETPRQLRAALSDRGLSQQALARLAGVDPRTTRRWCDERAGSDRPLALGPIAIISLALDRFDASIRATASQDPAASPASTASTGSNDPASSLHTILTT